MGYMAKGLGFLERTPAISTNSSTCFPQLAERTAAEVFERTEKAVSGSEPVRVLPSSVKVIERIRGMWGAISWAALAAIFASSMSTMVSTWIMSTPSWDITLKISAYAP